MNKLFFARHLPTEYNIEGRIIGQLDIPLTENTNAICTTKLDELSSVNIISSSLMRCKQTANVITKTVKCDVENINFSNLFWERNLGDFQGQLRNDIMTISPYFFDDSKIRIDVTPPNGETFFEFKNRMMKAKNTITNELVNNNVLVISHLHVLKMLKLIISNKSIEENWNTFTFRFGEIVQIIVEEL